MLTDARKFSNNHQLESDICVIGAGAAGISIARQFATGSSRVLLLESGGFELDPRIQALYDGETTGRRYSYHRLDNSRLRYFGGSTNHFGGACRILDPIDFEARPWMPGSGWPFRHEHMAPFYKRALRVFQVSPDGFDPDVWARGTGYPRIDVDSRQMETRIWQYHPLRFGPAYRRELVNSPKVTVCLYATAMGFDMDSSKTRVSTLRCAVPGGPAFTVASRVYVLCCGGMENARLLLLSREDGSLRFDQGGVLGRYFMEHLVVDNAAQFADGGPGDAGRFVRVRRAQRLLFRRGDCAARGACPRRTPSKRSRSLARGEASTDWTSGLGEIWDAVKHARLPDQPGVALGRVFAGLDDRIDQTVRRAFNTRSGIFNNLRPLVGGAVSAYVEQAPNPDSRISLIDERDSMGQRKIRFNWQLSRSDKRSLLRTLEIVGAELARLGIGRVRITLSEDLDEWPDDLETHCHHMGTTRMDRDPKGGVVDEDCRVHGIENLYVAGSSVFPTVGSAAPTLTIIALALRLADHLKQRQA